MIGSAIALLRRELRVSLVDSGAIGTALGFYLVVVTLIPLGLGPDLKLLARIAPGVLWIGLLLAALLSLGRLFESDIDDGSLDALSLAPLPLEVTVAVKSLAHWISTGLPLVFVTPLLGLLLNLDLDTYLELMGTMLIGTHAISFIGAIGAALTVRAERSGLLVALLVLPLYIPTLIFGVAAVSAHLTGPGSAAPPLLNTLCIKAPKMPPASMGCNCLGSPTETSLAPALSAASWSKENSREPTMPASSRKSTVLSVSFVLPSRSDRRRLAMVRDGMPVSRERFCDAAADWQQPATSNPAAS